MSIRLVLEDIQDARIRKQYKVAMIAALRIKVLPEPPSWKRQHRYKALGVHTQLNINCFAYALGLHKRYCDTAFDDALHNINRYYASPDFMTQYLSNHARLKGRATLGDLVVYFDAAETPKHAGICAPRRRDEEVHM